MKKALSIVLAAGLLLAGTNAFAQISVGVGYSNVTQRIKASGLNKDLNMNGLIAGMDYNIPISENISVVPGLYYEFSSGVANNLLNLGAISTVLTGRLEEHYIDIPFKLMFSIPYQGNRFFAFAGPTVTYGVASQVKADANIFGFSTKLNLLDTYDKGLLERMDLMLGGGIGFDYRDMLRFSLGYNLGMFNRISDEAKATDSSSEDSGFSIGQFIRNNATINRQQFYVGVAFLF
jgi:hypothetical protein